MATETIQKRKDAQKESNELVTYFSRIFVLAAYWQAAVGGRSLGHRTGYRIICVTYIKHNSQYLVVKYLLNKGRDTQSRMGITILF